ncbi:MAG TPA: hypothetical protein VGI67_17030 [Thermoleophilaceae bacterium]|jgi:hypothetical protein
MENWFDRLAARPHTRRGALKLAGAGIAAASLPSFWPGRAAGSGGEACYRFCLNAAFAHPFELASTDCAELRNQAKGKRATSKAARRAQACYAKALGDYQRGKLQCSKPQCGDPQTYPGGDPSGFAPTAGGCPPGTSGCIQGDCCCASGSGCCPCAATGTGCICCVSGVNCSDCCPGG